MNFITINRIYQACSTSIMVACFFMIALKFALLKASRILGMSMIGTALRYEYWVFTGITARLTNPRNIGKIPLEQNIALLDTYYNWYWFKSYVFVIIYIQCILYTRDSTAIRMFHKKYGKVEWKQIFLYKNPSCFWFFNARY